MASIKSVVQSIRMLGLSCRYNHALSEYRVNYIDAPEDMAYYTDDAQDALDTARAFVNRMREVTANV